MIRARLEKPFRTLLSDARHEICADLAPELGGEDKGPNPHELLEAALAACTLQTMQMYAARKGWDIQASTVIVKVLSEGAQVLIGRTIHFDAQLPLEQKTKLAEIANKCPVHKLLQAPTVIQTEVL